MRNFIDFKRFVLFLTLFVLPFAAYAQMFSVQPDRQGPAGIPGTSIKAGVSYMDFSYNGEFASVSNTTFVRAFQFNAPMLYMGVDLEGFSAWGLYGRTMGPRNVTYTQIGASIGNEFYLIPGFNFSLTVPLKLATDYVVAKPSGDLNLRDEFKQNTFGIHSGIGIRARLSRSVRFHADGSAGFSYSVSGMGSSGGTVVDWGVRNRFFIDEITGRFGLVAGFDINRRNYNLEIDRFDYKATQQVLVIGITF